jgi:hypothetical protein
MPVLRWVAALAALGGAVPVLAAVVAAHSADAAALLLRLPCSGAGWCAADPGGGTATARLLGAAGGFGTSPGHAARSAAANGRRTAASRRSCSPWASCNLMLVARPLSPRDQAASDPGSPPR